jgi:hypothetical protein
MCQAAFCTTNHHTIQFAFIYTFNVEWRPDWIWMCSRRARKIVPEKYYAARLIDVQRAQPEPSSKAAEITDTIASVLATIYSQFY